MRRPRRATRAAVLASLLGALGLAAGCGSGDGSGGRGVAGVAGHVTVFAAASLEASFTELARAFDDAHPDASVTLSLGSSATLAAQLAEGAPADVFASADEASMARVVDAGRTSAPPARFATNALRIVTAPGNPQGVAGVADLARPDLVVVTGGPEVPIGRYTAELFRRAGVAVTPRSHEADVKAVLTKVALGEADAGVVYATDVVAAGDAVTGVVLPPGLEVVASYVITPTTDDGVARAFVELVLGPDGRAVLAAAGFGPP